MQSGLWSLCFFTFQFCCHLLNNVLNHGVSILRQPGKRADQAAFSTRVAIENVCKDIRQFLFNRHLAEGLALASAQPSIVDLMGRTDSENNFFFGSYMANGEFEILPQHLQNWPEQSTKCPNCHREIIRTWNYCPSCGKRTSEEIVRWLCMTDIENASHLLNGLINYHARLGEKYRAV